MSDFFAARGCVYRVEPPTGSGGKGWYDVEGLSRGEANTPTLVLGCEISAAGLIQPSTTLDNSKFIYTFGVDFSAATISGEILLGVAGGAGPQGMAELQSFFNTKQVAVSKAPVNVSCPGGLGYSVYLTGLSFGRVDVEFNVQPWAMSGIIADSVGR